jgi:hypothetical protein
MTNGGWLRRTRCRASGIGDDAEAFAVGTGGEFGELFAVAWGEAGFLFGAEGAFVFGGAERFGAFHFQFTVEFGAFADGFACA